MIVKELEPLLGKHAYGFWARHYGLSNIIAILVLLVPMPYHILPLLFDRPIPDTYPIGFGVICLLGIVLDVYLEFVNRGKGKNFILRNDGLEFQIEERRTEVLFWAEIQGIKELTKHQAKFWRSVAIELVTADGRAYRIYSRLRNFEAIVHALKLQVAKQNGAV